MALLEIESLQVTYGGSVLAVDDASLSVPEGGAVALLGANGAGKTTMLRAVGGLLRHHHGEVRKGTIRFEGRPIVGTGAPRLVAAGIGQCLEGRRVFAELTVEDNLKIGSFVPRARAAERARRQEMLDLFPRLGERIASRAGMLSGGEQQMLAIARGLMTQPKLLLLDEPSLGLAPLVVKEIGEALSRIRQNGTALLLVDQSTSLALHASDHAYLMTSGRTVADGPTATLLQNDAVRESYLGTKAGQANVIAEVQNA